MCSTTNAFSYSVIVIILACTPLWWLLIVKEGELTSPIWVVSRNLLINWEGEALELLGSFFFLKKKYKFDKIKMMWIWMVAKRCRGRANDLCIHGSLLASTDLKELWHLLQRVPLSCIRNAEWEGDWERPREVRLQDCYMIPLISLVSLD